MNTIEQSTDDDELRNKLKALLASGLPIDIEPRAYDFDQIQQVIAQLQNLEQNDFVKKMVISGFTLEPYGHGEDEQACETCMYYQVHRKFCELPELMLPVEAKWSCRLWRI